MVVYMNQEQAEEVLIALSHRAKQKGIIGTEFGDGIIELGRSLSRTFEKNYDWDSGVFDRHLAIPLTVTVKRQKGLYHDNP